MAFPETPVELLAEMQIGGTWTDITGDLYARVPLTIERGRPDEAARVDPSRATFQLDNRQNLYSPSNPRSANYGLIGRNTPVRFSVPGTESYLALDGDPANTAATPDHASLAITDLDVRAELTMDWYSATLNQTIMGQWGADGNRGWTWRISENFSIINWTVNGLSATQGIAFVHLPSLPRRAALRMTLDVNNGAGGHTGSLYWAESLDGPWTLVSQFTGAGTTSIFNSTAPLEIAPDLSTAAPLPRRPFIGRGHRFSLLSSIGGAPVANPDFRAQTPGATSFADAAGRTWTLTGAAQIANREYRLHAEVSSWPARWDVSGQDIYVPVEASGILRRLGQGAKALASTLRRRIPAYSPVAYWPLEDGREAEQAASPIVGVLPLTVSGFDFASDETCPGSSSLPKLQAAASAIGTVPAYTSTGQYLVSFVYLKQELPTADNMFLEFSTTGTASRITVTMSSIQIAVRGYDSTGAVVLTVNIAPLEAVGDEWHRFDISATDTGGGNVEFHIGWITVGGGGFQHNLSITGTVGIVTGINTAYGPELADMRIGHIVVFPTSATAVFSTADGGYRGEAAGSRLVRLGTEESVPIRLDQPPATSAALGAQRPAPLLALMSESADADGGLLYEDRDAVALRYKARELHYNRPVALTLDYAVAGHVAPPLEPTDDDQAVRNDRTVTRTGGSSARAVAETGPLSVQAPPLGVGIYDDSRTLNLHTDSQPEQIADWLLHLGTWDESRYPTVRIDLAAAPHLIPDVLSLDIGDRIQIINPPTWLPPGPIDLIVEGYTETIGHPSDWDIVLNCSPAGPWSVAVADDMVLGRADTSGSTLASGVTSTATSLSVTTASGPLWSTTDEPYDVRIGGEVMTVTAVTGASSPQSVTVTRSVNGITKAHLAGADVRLAQPAITSY